MRYRKLSAAGDYTFGQPLDATFLVDTPAAVAQAIRTRLLLWEGEWFIDTSDGTPYPQKVLGAHTVEVADAAIRKRIIETTGVRALVDYSSSKRGRALTVQATVQTQYGLVSVIEEVELKGQIDNEYLEILE
jgi:hypothetical protein